MRKWVWYACLLAVLAAADMLGSAYYVYKNPNSLLGRSAMAGVLVGTRYNPLLYTYEFVSDKVATVMQRDEEATPAEQNFERPEEPAAVEEAEAVEPAAPDDGEAAGLPVRWGHIVLEADANAADQPADEPCWFAGAFENTPEPPLVDADCDHCHSPCCWFMQAVYDCVSAAKSMSDACFFRCWFSYFTSPSMLDDKGDAETSEPMDDATPDSSREDPYQSYHHNDCPYSGVCPYSGKMPSYEPETPVQSEPKKLPKVKMLPPLRDGAEESETPTRRPDIDTMEFRDSDRTWDDYGDPMQL